MSGSDTVPAPPGEAGPVDARRRWRTIGFGLVVVGSIAVTAFNHDSIHILRRSGAMYGLALAAVMVTQAASLGSLAVVASIIAGHAFSSVRHLRLQQMRAFLSPRTWTDEVLRRAHGDRRFKVAFTFNWVAAITAALVPAVIIVVLLPVSAWGLLGVCAFDVGSAAILRAAIHSRLRGMEVSA